MARSSTSAPDRGARCGREIEWRKKWEHDWHSVKWCSTACRQRGLTDLDRSLEAMIIHLLQQRSRTATICPSEAARQFDLSGGGPHGRFFCCAARRLVATGAIDIMQRESLLTLQQKVDQTPPSLTLTSTTEVAEQCELEYQRMKSDAVVLRWVASRYSKYRPPSSGMFDRYRTSRWCQLSPTSACVQSNIRFR